MVFVTLQGIQDIIVNLAPKPGTLQDRLLSIIASYFPTDQSIQETTSISSDEIIKAMWSVDTLEEIRPKKKNLSSLKSAINKKLKELAENNKNPEGLIIGRENVFTISEEHKNELLKQFGQNAGADPAAEMLASLRGMLDEIVQGGDSDRLKSMLSELDQTRDLIDHIVKEKGLGGDQKISEGDDSQSDDDRNDDFEEIELGEDEELVVMKKQSGDETGGSQNIGNEYGSGEHTETEALEGDDGESVDDLSTESASFTEEGDTLDLAEDEPTADSGLADKEESESTGIGELIGSEESGEESGSSGEDDKEDLAAPGVAGPEDYGGSYSDGQGRELGDGQLHGQGIDFNESDFDILEDVDIVEELEEEETTEDLEEVLDEEEADIIEAEEDELEEVEEEILEIDEDGEIGTLGQEDGESTAAGDLADQEGSEGSTGTGELPSPEGSGEKSGSIGEGYTEGLTGPGMTGLGTQGGSTSGGQGQEIGDGQLHGQGVDLNESDYDILDEVDIVEELEEEEADIVEAEVDELEEVEEDEITEELEEVIDEEEADIIETEEGELEEVEEVDVLEVEEGDLEEADLSSSGENDDNLGSGEERSSSDYTKGTGETDGRPIDLSRYIEPSEALASLPETLSESTDELLNMIMERFMPPFIKIPAGQYIVGSKNPSGLERTQQKIILKDFYISQLPVTNDLFDFFIRETGYETDAEKMGFGTVIEGRFAKKIDSYSGKEILIINSAVHHRPIEGANWRHPTGPDSSLENKASHPVVQVSHRDAVAFAAWAGKKLPSEDEWEAAARGPEGQLFPWGDEWQDKLGNFESSQNGDTTPVVHYGKKGLSPFGLIDMLGNVLEWTSARIVDNEEESIPDLYILKGGSWATGGIVPAARRFIESETWSNIIGFRCAV